MQTIIHNLIKSAFIVILVATAVAVDAQDAKLHFERLSALETKARDVVEVNVDGKLLDLAKRVTTKINDKDERTIGQVTASSSGQRRDTSSFIAPPPNDCRKMALYLFSERRFAPSKEPATDFSFGSEIER